MVAVIIAEKPSVAEDLARVLGAGKKMAHHWEGEDLRITWAVGHLLELLQPEEYDDKYRRWKMDDLPIIPEEFIARPMKGRGGNSAQLKEIIKLMKASDVTEVVNACDAAREGELIFWRIYKHSGISCTLSRMWMQSMTKTAIQAAWDGRQPAKSFGPLRDAAISRAEADWIIGMNGTRAVTLRLPKKRNEKSPFSIGRVQTATLAIVVDRELEHLAHIPEPFWTVEADISVDDSCWNAKWKRKGSSGEGAKPNRITDAQELAKVEAALGAEGVATITQTVKEREEKAPLNFDLTTLQRIANSRWNWPARRTLGVAQRLYEEHKLTTYPRTDSKFLPKDMEGEMPKLLEELGTQSAYSPHTQRLQQSGLTHTGRNFNDSKVSDHFAIIPTGKTPTGNLPSDAANLYDLIVRRFLSSFHPHATWEDEYRIAEKGGEQLHAKGSTLKTKGWREVIPKKDAHPEGWGTLPSQTCEGNVEALQINQELTKPKSRMKEAGLLSAMENAGKVVEDDEFRDALKEKGLGTPATRAETIETLMNRGYVDRLKNGSMRANSRGILLIDVLRRTPIEWVTNAELTGQMEARLKQVHEGVIPRENYMNHIIERTQDLVDKMSNLQMETLYEDCEPLGPCPLCEGVVKEGLLTYGCEHNRKGGGCAFVMWKESSGRHFDRLTAERLLAESNLADLHGFINRSGEEFTATISRDERGRIQFAKQGPSAAEAKEFDVLTSCPTCEEGEIHTTLTHWVCDNEDCRSRPLSKSICKREMHDSEALAYYDEGRTAIIEDFTSKKGRPFSASLVRNRGRMEFDFPPRSNGAGANAPVYEVKDGVVGTYDYRGTKVPVIETPSTFEAAENDQGIRLSIPRTLSKREITRTEAKVLVEKGAVGPLDDFISKKGKPFSATLHIDRNGRVRYRFG